MTAPTRWRAGDTEREAVAEVLRAAHVEGRLGLAEFGERLDAAFAATYLDELGPLTADLPPVGAAVPAVPAVPARGRSRRGGPPRPPAGLLVLLLVVFAIAALVSGQPPWPLLWLGGLLVLLGHPGRHGWPHRV